MEQQRAVCKYDDIGVLKIDFFGHRAQMREIWLHQTKSGEIPFYDKYFFGDHKTQNESKSSAIVAY